MKNSEYPDRKRKVIKNFTLYYKTKIEDNYFKDVIIIGYELTPTTEDPRFQKWTEKLLGNFSEVYICSSSYMAGLINEELWIFNFKLIKIKKMSCKLNYLNEKTKSILRKFSNDFYKNNKNFNELLKITSSYDDIKFWMYGDEYAISVKNKLCGLINLYTKEEILPPLFYKISACGEFEEFDFYFDDGQHLIVENKDLTSLKSFMDNIFDGKFIEGK